MLYFLLRYPYKRPQAVESIVKRPPSIQLVVKRGLPILRAQKLTSIVRLRLDQITFAIKRFCSELLNVCEGLRNSLKNNHKHFSVTGCSNKLCLYLIFKLMSAMKYRLRTLETEVLHLSPEQV